ncbi:MAG: hypothetical protein MZV64_13140 [Ignavibacteriales bacterium]|nr:hypothetical protein [Ignavibacteriales bacterium]
MNSAIISEQNPLSRKRNHNDDDALAEIRHEEEAHLPDRGHGGEDRPPEPGPGHAGHLHAPQRPGRRQARSREGEEVDRQGRPPVGDRSVPVG